MVGTVDDDAPACAQDEPFPPGQHAQLLRIAHALNERGGRVRVFVDQGFAEKETGEKGTHDAR
jgi:hypothetical protein